MFRRIREIFRLFKDQHPEAICDDCGGTNVTWFAPSYLWNKVARRLDGTDPMLCPRCFIIRAEAMGINDSAWMVVPAFTTLNELIIGECCEE